MLPQYFAQYYNGYHNMMDGGDWGWGLLMMLFWVVVIVGVVLLVVRGSKQDSAKADDALDIAKKRYAKGELTKNEYEQIKKELAGH